MDITSTYFFRTGIWKGREDVALSITESNAISARMGDNGLPIAVPFVAHLFEDEVFL